jgi:aldehyde:ferredoxin oxidoreductase
MKGYAGSILRVDLTTGQTRKEAIDPTMARTFVGGRGFAAKILYDEVPASADPLGPDNKVVMAAGPLTGLFVPAAGKVTFAAKSPATGGWGDSNMGGHVSSEMKYAGYDVIVIEGASAKPVMIVIDNDKVEIRDAGHVWGKGTYDAETSLKQELGEDFQISLIGPAGENIVKYACISHDFGRQAGRTGVGAVLGSKKVKAIAIRGNKTIPVADPQGMLKLGKEAYDRCFADPNLKEWQDYGTAGVTVWADSIGAFPTRNFKTGNFEGVQNLSGEKLRREAIVNDKACFSCPMACGKYSKITHAGKEYHAEGPEYETTALVGGNCALTDIKDVVYINYIMDDLGLDTISGGNTIAFAIECFEKGLIKPEDVNGMNLEFGNVEVVAELSRMIAAREGLGDMLAEGVRESSRRLGGDSADYAIQIKGLEWSGYESRYAPTNMLAYCTSDIGAHHGRAWAITHDIAVGRDEIAGKAQRVIELQHIRPMFDSLGVCRLPWVEISFGLDYYPEALEKATGEPWTLDELMLASERVFNLTRAFWLKHVPDFGRAYDFPPARFMEEPMPSGPAAGHCISKEVLGQMLDEYYELRGWNENGIPSKKKLVELGLMDAACAMYGDSRKD